MLYLYTVFIKFFCCNSCFIFLDLTKEFSVAVRFCSSVTLEGFSLSENPCHIFKIQLHNVAAHLSCSTAQP